jgi:hypothetical protein
MAENLYGSKQVAAMLHKRPVTIRANAKKYGIGRILSHDYIFTDEDIEKLRALPAVGRPKRAPKEPVSDDPQAEEVGLQD